MKLEHQQQDWDELAEFDPYWAILTSPGKRFGRWDSDEFFATGEREVDGVMDRIARLGRPERRERVLDFGCGLGRLTRAFAEHFGQCTGVDISERMVQGARRLNDDVQGVSFVVNRTGDLARFAEGEFDLVYSVLVLQHIPDRHAIKRYIVEFCRVIRPGGLAVFQLPSHISAIYRLQWRRKLYLGLRRVGFDPAFLYQRLLLIPIAMSFLPEREVVHLLQSSGAQTLDVQTSTASGVMNWGVKSGTYYVTR